MNNTLTENFANDYTPIDYANRKLESYLRNEVIAEVLATINNDGSL